VGDELEEVIAQNTTYADDVKDIAKAIRAYEKRKIEALKDLSCLSCPTCCRKEAIDDALIALGI
jgi:hypothetical protein